MIRRGTPVLTGMPRPVRFLAFLHLAAATGLPGQAAPGTDVYLVSLTPRGGRLVAGAPVNLTARAGYDNQPAFTPDGQALLYSTIGADGHADFCRIELATMARACRATTPESEYSPAVAPMGGVSVVRVERDSTQRLWRFPDGEGEPEVLFPALKPVGYYAWVDADHVVAFVLGTPATMQAADRVTSRADTIATDVGRSPQRMPDGGISFLQREGGVWLLRRYDPVARQTTTITRALSGSDFHAWMPDGNLLMARGDELFRWRSDAPAWQPLAAFAADGIRQITRLAVSPDGRFLAFVAEDSAP
jgi:Tol biopolymer transport system component